MHIRIIQQGLRLQTRYVINQDHQLAPSNDRAAPTVWIDLFHPNAKERSEIGKELDIILPNHADMHQIEYTNRFSKKERSFHFCLDILTKAAPMPENHIISLILTPEKLLTIRYAEVSVFNSLTNQSDQHPVKDHLEVFLLILRKIIGHVADIFELIGEQADQLNMGLIGSRKRGKQHAKRLNHTLSEVNYLRTLLSKSYHSLSGLTSLMSFFNDADTEIEMNESFMKHLSYLRLDVSNLIQYSEHLTEKLEFSLQSTLGLINVEQTQIIKIFTVLAMIFMPPTLIASIYGMNFSFMPELKSPYAYPIVLVVMLISSIIPYRYFKKKGWI